MSIAQVGFAETIYAGEKSMRGSPMILLMSNDLLRTTGARIRALVEDRSISLKELARQLDMSQSFLSQILRGKKPPLDTVVQLADILDTTTDYLLLRTDNHNRPAEFSDAAPHYFSPEADEIARMIDDLPPWKRVEMLYMVRASAGFVAEAHKRAELVAKDIQTALRFSGSTIDESVVRSIAAALEGAWTGSHGNDK